VERISDALDRFSSFFGYLEIFSTILATIVVKVTGKVQTEKFSIFFIQWLFYIKDNLSNTKKVSENFFRFRDNQEKAQIKLTTLEGVFLARESL